MQAIATIFFLAGIILAVLAIPKNGFVRKWFRSRNRPGVVSLVLIVAWLVGFVALVNLAAPSNQSATTAAGTDRPTTTAAPPSSTTVPPATSAAESEPATSTPPAGAPDGVPADVQKVVVKRIVDGDTLELAAVASGAALSSTQQVDVRLLEIDTPETKHPSEPVQCYGVEATNRLSELAPAGSTVWVQRDEELRDQYGRYLFYLWNDEGTFVNLTLVEEGYAAAKLYEPNDKHWKIISAAETDAKAADEGLWRGCASFGEPVNTPEPTPEPVPEPQPVPDDDDGGGGYLFPPPPPDKDCGDVSASNFRVRPGDPHRFDRDGDGIGCEG